MSTTDVDALIAEIDKPLLDDPLPVYDDADKGDALEVADENPGNLIMQLIKQLSVGMDLMRVTIPAAFLETRSLLEMYADLNSYPQLFTDIPKQKDPQDRLVAVLKWFFSAVSCRKGVKKPFNPILGEVFRCKWDQRDKGDGVTYFIAEQVTHHPPCSAFYVENLGAGIVYNGHICTRSKFYGTSAGVINEGQSSIFLRDFDEEYILRFPSGYIRGLLTGNLRFEFGDEIKISCAKTGYSAHVQFVTKPYIGGTWDSVKGKVELTEGNTTRKIFGISGKWNDTVFLEEGKKKTPLYEMGAQRAVRKEMLDPEELELHESRRVWNKAITALKGGDVNKSNEEKTAVEKRQREKRKIQPESDWTQRHFRLVEDGTSTDRWVFNGFSVERRWEDLKQYAGDEEPPRPEQHEKPGSELEHQLSSSNIDTSDIPASED